MNTVTSLNTNLCSTLLSTLKGVLMIMTEKQT